MLLLRYLLREILVPLVVWVAFLFLLLFVMSFLRGSEVLLGSAVTASDLARFAVYLAPHFLQQALPIAFLLAILLGLGRLAEDHELTALQSLGMGPLQLLLGPLLLGAVIGGTMLLLSFTAEPWGLRSVKEAVNEVIKKNMAGDVKPGVFYEELTNLTLYTEQVEGGDRRWTNVLVHDDRDPSGPLLVLAHRGKVNSGQPGEALELSLSEGSVHRANPSTLEYSVLDFERGELAVGVADSFFRKNKFGSPKEELTPGELLGVAREVTRRGENPAPWLMTFHWRLGQALMPVAFALMGTPLAMSRRQGGRARGFIFTLGGYIFYYVLARVCVSLGEQGRLPFLFAGQFPNFAFGLVGALGLARVWGTGAQR